LGTHFFNPPTYAQLVEIIPGQNTLPQVTQFMNGFIKNRLGKSPMVVKDTPNFIANRLGIVTSINTFNLCLQQGIRVEEADALCGKAMGRMSSAIFVMADAVGLDTVSKVIHNIYENAIDDERRESFIIPGYVEQMIQNNWLGDKTHMGFYKTEKDAEGEVRQMVLDINTVQYRERIEPNYPCLQAVAKVKNPAEKVWTLIYGNDPGALFAWEVLASDLIYAANRVTEIADTIVEIDNAMKWGYYWRLGPFECWDAIGLRQSVARMNNTGKSVPSVVEKMLEKGYESFYIEKDGINHYFDFVTGSYQPVV
jgi:3-hydroxyacyl-CoA dehydrogenase